MNECTESGKRVAITAHACRYYSAQRYFWWGDPKLEHINIKNGVLVHNTKESFKSLNKMNLKNGLTLYFKDDAIKADDATETVMNNREKVIKETLKLKRF